MIDKGLLKVLVCPKDHSPLTLADSRLTARLNRAISAGRVVNCGGRSVSLSRSAAVWCDKTRRCSTLSSTAFPFCWPTKPFFWTARMSGVLRESHSMRNWRESDPLLRARLLARLLRGGIFSSVPIGSSRGSVSTSRLAARISLARSAEPKKRSAKEARVSPSTTVCVRRAVVRGNRHRHQHVHRDAPTRRVRRARDTIRPAAEATRSDSDGATTVVACRPSSLDGDRIEAGGSCLFCPAAEVAGCRRAMADQQLLAAGGLRCCLEPRRRRQLRRMTEHQRRTRPRHQDAHRHGDFHCRVDHDGSSLRRMFVSMSSCHDRGTKATQRSGLRGAKGSTRSTLRAGSNNHIGDWCDAFAANPALLRPTSLCGVRLLPSVANVPRFQRRRLCRPDGPCRLCRRRRAWPEQKGPTGCRPMGLMWPDADKWAAMVGAGSRVSGDAAGMQNDHGHASVATASDPSKLRG